MRFLNDRQEFFAGWRILRDAAESEFFAQPELSARRRQDVRDLFENDEAFLGLQIYSVSFSNAIDELGQWRGYADDGYGASVVVQRQALDQAFGWRDDMLCSPVMYDGVDHSTFALRLVQAILSNELSLDDTLVALQLAAVFMKHEGFSAEREYRLIRISERYDVRESRRRPVPYLDPLANHDPLPLERVIVGSAWQLGTLDEAEFQRHHVTLGVRRTLDRYGLDAVPVERSAIPYDLS